MLSDAVAPLADPVEVARRRARLTLPHMRPLARLAQEIRDATGLHVPDADPLDGGTASPLLLLLETPGPSIRATGFVSRDNPTPTARNLRRFLGGAEAARTDTLIWNAVPWTIHAPDARNRAPSPAEQAAAMPWLERLVALLPELRAVVLAGRVARALRPELERRHPALPCFETAHPSPTIVCTDPAIGADIASTFRQAARAAARKDRT